MDMYAVKEELLEVAFHIWFVLGLYNEDQWGKSAVSWESEFVVGG